jgi:hypothetical protein
VGYLKDQGLTVRVGKNQVFVLVRQQREKMSIGDFGVWYCQSTVRHRCPA